MNDPRDCAQLDRGDVRFYDDYVPELPAGDYLINVAQRVNPAGTQIDEGFAASQPFSVQGPRYTLPPTDVLATFPANEEQGRFHQFLPHVVFTQRELPWERSMLRLSEAAKRPVPWMALLVFADGEQVDGEAPLVAPQSGTSSRTMATGVTALDLFNHAADEGVLWPPIERRWYETDEVLGALGCSVVDVSPAAFRALVMPLAGDLPYLAHVRQVDASAKPGDIVQLSANGWYSVLVANRLPDPPDTDGAPGRRNIVHLVSLEGWEEHLLAKAAIDPGVTRVRMISLASWSFTCLPDPAQGFARLANGLLVDSSGVDKSTRLAMPVDPSQAPPSQTTAYALRALDAGYVPLRYQTRLGEQTFAWYRGPLSPEPVAPFVLEAQQSNGARPFGTASSALSYDPAHGVFDVSYAVAWETGRQLALSDGAFGRALLDWQRDGHRLIDLILERKAQIPQLASFDPAAPDVATEQSLIDQIRRYAITDDFVAYLTGQLSGQLAAGLGDPTPTAPGADLPPYPTVPSPPPTPASIADLLEEPDVVAAIQDVGGQGLDTIADWLAQRYLLVGLPFETLVAHGGLLPPESIRFFYLDSNWLDMVLAGALSIGIDSSRDRVYQDLMRELIWDLTLGSVQRVRSKLLGQAAPTTLDPPLEPAAMGGMLLRSALVSGWPGLQVRAYAAARSATEPEPTSAIPLLRSERVGTDTLLCLWPSVPSMVTLDEPDEGTAFGFEESATTPEAEFCVFPRSMDPSSYGTSLSPALAVDAVAAGVIDATRVVKVLGSGGLVQALEATLPGGPSLAVRDFAVQLVKVPERAVFGPAPPPPPPQEPDPPEGGWLAP